MGSLSDLLTRDIFYLWSIKTFWRLERRTTLYTTCFNLAGSQSEFFINNTKAGPGALAVTIEGPSKVKMDCQEVSDGYKVQYTPMAPGNYLISIKYGGPNHISGSPFKAKVTGDVESSGQVLVLISRSVEDCLIPSVLLLWIKSENTFFPPAQVLAW